MGKNQASSLELAKINSHYSHPFHLGNKIEFFSMTIMLDSEVKNYKARIYGIIDAIGTLGGTYGIVFWTIMLFYGTIRKNLYLISIINSLYQGDYNQENELWANEEQHNNALVKRDRQWQLFRQRLVRSGKTQTLPNVENQRESSLRNDTAFRVDRRENNDHYYDHKQSIENSKGEHSYDVLIKSLLPFKCWISNEENYARYK